MHIFVLLNLASKRLEEDVVDPYLTEQTDTVIAMLRSVGVLPYKRASINSGLHRLLAAMLVTAYDHEASVDVAYRSAGTYHDAGYSTLIPKYLDKMVVAGFLTSKVKAAKGRCVLTPLLTTYLDRV